MDESFAYAAGARVRRTAEKLDAWAAENPYQAVAAGAVIGFASSVLFNRLFLLKGAAAVTSILYGAIKGAATGYAYPTVRDHARKSFL